MTTTNPLVSIVLNVYNGQKFIAQQIDSILSQTYSNFELIICDNNSTDSTYSILKEYAKKDDRVRIIRNKINLGLIKSFEVGLKNAKGEYVAPSDGDDVWVPEKIALKVKYLLDNPKIDLVYTNSTVVDTNLTTIEQSFQKILGGPHTTFEQLLQKNTVPVQVILFKKKLIEKIIPIPDGFMHDYWISLIASLQHQIGFIDKSTVLYRQHQSNTVGFKVPAFSFYLNKINNQQFIIDFLQQRKIQSIGFEKLLKFDISKNNQELLKTKIDILNKLISFNHQLNFFEFYKKLFILATEIVFSTQKYHLKHCLYLFLTGPIKQ